MPLTTTPPPTAPSGAPPPPAGPSGWSSEPSRTGSPSSLRDPLHPERRQPSRTSTKDDDLSESSESFSGVGRQYDDDDDDDSSSSSSSSSSSQQPVPSLHYATSSVPVPPTPYNTVFDEYAYADVGGPETSYISYNDQEATRDIDGTYTQVHSLMTPTMSRPEDDYIPQSTRPIPAPPQLRSSTETNLSPIQSSSWESKVGVTEPSDDGHGRNRKQRFTRRFRRRQITQVDRDTARLQQLGYDAVLGRQYTFWSSLALGFMNLGAVQGTVFAVPGAYKHGGPAMMLVAWPISFVLSVALVSTLSELASAYPVAGGMASWAWKCARAGIGGERYWGWIMSAFVLGGHVGNLVLLTWQITSVITGTMGLAFQYEAQRWHLVLFFLAVILVVGGIGNTATASSSRYWVTAGCFGVMVWTTICVSLLATGVRSRDYSVSQAISTHFSSNTGWASKGYVYILGWQYHTIAVGSDVCAHMSEETQNPSRNVPKAMTWSIILTYLLGYISIIICFLAVAPEDAAFLASQEFPVGHILAKAISNRGAIALCSLIIIIMSIQVQAQLQAASRFVFAMARDRALPFSDQIKQTNKNKQPWIATWICIALTAPFACLLIGSAGVIYSVVTVGAASLSMLSYLIPVALYLVCKLDLRVEGRSAWTLRQFSRPVAAVGALFCLAVVVVQILPGKSPVTAQNMSWSPVVIAGTLAISFATWRLYGNQHYSGPIRALTKWETGMEIDLDSTLQASTNRGNDATSLKLAVTPCYPETVPTVQVNSAHTVDSDISMGEWATASFTTTEELSRSRTDSSGSWNGSGHTGRRRGTTTTMGRVDEEGEQDDIDFTPAGTTAVDILDPNSIMNVKDDDHVPDHHAMDLEKGLHHDDDYEKYLGDDDYEEEEEEAGTFKHNDEEKQHGNTHRR